LYADWDREYRPGRQRGSLLDELDDGLSWWEFSTLLAGLSEHSVWRKVAADEPIELSSEEARAEISTW
jgi:hypothetical protein